MKNLLKTVAVGGAGFVPFLAFGQTSPTLLGLIDQFSAIANATIPFIVGLAVVVIVWGVFNYIVGAGDEEKRAAAKQYIIWGVIGVFVMLSIWGLINVLMSSFTLQRTPPAVIPGVVPQSANLVGSPCTIPATGAVGKRDSNGLCVP